MAALAPNKAPVTPLCHQCYQKPGISKCGQCRLISYCSKECQTIAWKADHKFWCTLDPNKIQEPHPKTGIPKALYFAAHGVWESLPAEIQALANQKMQTPHGLYSPEEVCALAQPVPTQGLTSFVLEEEGIERTLTQEEYHERFGTYFIDGIQMTGMNVIYYMQKQHLRLSDCNIKITKPAHKTITQKLIENSQQLVVKKESKATGWGLYTKTRLEKGDPICCFGGELLMNPPKCHQATSDNYNVGFSDGMTMTLNQTRFTGWGRSANDGPPDAVVGSLSDPTSPHSEHLAILIASKTIEPEQPIHLYYGSRHSIRTNFYSLDQMGYEELVAFCHRHLTTKAHWKETTRAFMNPKSDTHFSAMMQYILTTPKALIPLLLNKVIHPTQLLNLLNNPGIDFSQILTTYPLPILNLLMKNIQPVLADPLLVDHLLALTRDDTFPQGTLMQLFYINPKTTLSLESLPDYLGMTHVVREIDLMINANSAFYEEEGKAAPDIDIEALLAKQKKLPKIFQLKHLSFYITARMNVSNPKKHPMLKELAEKFAELDTVD